MARTVIPPSPEWSAAQRAARRAFWFDWRRRETEAQLAVQHAEEDNDAAQTDLEYERLCEIHAELSLAQRTWLGCWYENRRSLIRVRNRARTSIPIDPITQKPLDKED